MWFLKIREIQFHPIKFKIFKQFYRLDESRNSSTGGSGLGLSIAKTIVEQHHGFIKVKSENQKTSFDVMLPRHEL